MRAIDREREGSNTVYSGGERWKDYAENFGRLQQRRALYALQMWVS